MATNVKVMCRFRPPSKGEKAEGASIVTSVDPSATSVTIGADAGMTIQQGVNKFNFDRVFDFVTTQQEVFQYSAQPLVKDIFAGYNCTLFAYGQTGSGKTHTMMGDKTESGKGIIPRLVEAIFAGIEDAEVGIEFTVKVTYIEIYSERVRDLLTSRGSGSDNLKIREQPHGGVYIEGVTETYVSSVEQILQLMQQGQDARAIASTNMNEQSSRSHSVFILTLGQLDQNTGSKKGAKLTLVDLAGSEKVGKTGAAGQTLEEAKAINKSLSALGNVINALTSQGAHVPYRDSKLTRLLSDSLGGNSKTCLVVTGSPMSTNMEETLSTMRFGTRAKMIKNKATINQEKSVAEYKLLLSQATTKIGIQTNIIDLLEKDVASLLECVQSVDEAHLKLPIPSLLSRDVNALAELKRSKSIEVEGETTNTNGNDALTASIQPPPSSSAPPPNAAPTSTSPTPIATSPPPPSASAPPGTPATATATTTPAKGKAKSTRPSRAALVEGDSPPTSPDSTPENSPKPTPSATQPKPPMPAVVMMELPSLDSLTLSTGQPSALPPSSSPAASPSNATGAVRKQSAATSGPNHSLTELMLTNSDLSQQLSELRAIRRALENNLEDVKKESQEALDAFEKDRTRMADEVAAALAAKKNAEEKAEKAEEMMTEFNLLKQKIDYEKKEHALALSQVEASKTELSEEVTHLLNKIQALEHKLVAQTKAYDSAMEKVAAESAASVSASGSGSTSTVDGPSNAASAPSTPQDKEKTVKSHRSRMSAPPEHMVPFSPIGPSSDTFSFQPDPSLTISEEQSQIEQLSRGLKRKCDQFIALSMQHQTQGERVEALEVALEEANQRLKDHLASSARKTKELEEKLLAAENLCSKFVQSGRYWRQERNAKQQKATTSKIMVPIQSGGGKKLSSTSPSHSLSPSFDGSNTTSASTSASSSLPSSSVGSPDLPRQTTTSRLSGGIASGARSAITSIQSAFGSKPKHQTSDSMSSFF